MKKVILLAFVIGCVSLPYVAPALRSPVDQERGSVLVEVSCGEQDPFSGDYSSWLGNRFGSGVMVSERHVLTAAHVVSCPVIAQAWVTLSNGRRLRMAVEREDLDADVARLVIASADRFHHALSPPQTRWDIDGIGCVRMGAATYACAAFRGTELAVVTRPGSSGEGVYDVAGRLVGIVIRTIHRSTGNTTRFARVDAGWIP